jgi:hypothetical protein
MRIEPDKAVAVGGDFRRKNVDVGVDDRRRTHYTA